MRVEVAADLKVPAAHGPGIESRALQAFLAALASDDSLLNVAEWTVTSPEPSAAGDSQQFEIFLALVFRADGLKQNRGLYFSLLEKLTGLLQQAGSADSLEARLGLEQESGPAQSTRLIVQLRATGNSTAQAEMRWGLGLAHLQQALLFTSRYLRQQFSARND